MSLAPLDPIDRAWWHLHLSPEILYADQREQPACSAEPLEFDDCEDYEQGRVCRLQWSDLNEEDRTILIRDRKDPRRKIGNNQLVPLINGSFDIIMRQPRTSEFIFPVNGDSWSSLFPRACDDLEIVDLRLYDLRHEAISRLVESRKYSIPEMMLITGHKDPKQLMRYTQLRAKDLHR